MRIDRLNVLIKNSALNKTQIAEQSAISRTTLDNILAGSDAKVSTIENLCRVLGVSASYLFEGESISIGQISVNGAGVNSVNNDPDIINRFLSIIEEKDRQISELISKLK